LTVDGRKKLRRWNMQLREIDKWTLERRKEEERGGSYLHTHEEVLGSGESRDKHVTTPTPPFRTDLDTPIPALYTKTSLFFFFNMQSLLPFLRIITLLSLLANYM
jgi:hypothetical protein